MNVSSNRYIAINRSIKQNGVLAEPAAGDEKQGVGGAQQRSVYGNTRAASTDATLLVAPAVGLCKNSNISMPYLNYHHLRYFRAIAQEGNLTRAAQHLSISPSALSTQLAQLEENLGHALFNRSKKRLILTEAGHLALDYAETIFKTGEELFDALQHRVPKQRQVLRIGAVATLSRNFQLEIIKPVLKKREIELVLRTSPLSDLLNMLEAHTIDLVLSNLPVPADAQNGLRSHLISQQQVILVGHRPNKKFHFPESLHGTDMVLPSFESNIRVGFDLLMSQYNVRPRITAEVSDMAMLRLLAREIDAVALTPRVVVQEELKNKSLVELHRVHQIQENFYAITPSRHFPNFLVKEMIQAFHCKKNGHSKDK